MGTKRIWTCKGMIYKHVLPLSGLIGLVVGTSCTTYGVVSVLLLVPNSTYTKLSGSYGKLGKVVWYAPSWTLERFTTTPSTWGFHFPRLDFTPWVKYCPVMTLQTPSICCSFNVCSTMP
jgi:hypothetical protein